MKVIAARLCFAAVVSAAVVSAAVVPAAMSTASADVFFSGDTTGQPTWNRPQSYIALSATGLAVPYLVQPFYTTTTQSGAVLEVNGGTNLDTYALVYVDSFDPLDQLTNLVDGGDDFFGTFTVLTGTGQGQASTRIGPGEVPNYSGGTGLSLTANTQYYAIITGFRDDYFGTFDAGIGGVDLFLGTVAIPEPTCWAIFTALSTIGLAFRRRPRLQQLA